METKKKSALTIMEDQAKHDFLSVCNMQRLKGIVGEENAPRVLSDFLGIVKSYPSASYEELARCCVDIISMKLPLAKQTGQAYIVPRDGKLNVEIGYKGWLVLAKRVGFEVRVYPVFKGDEYDYRIEGFEEIFYFKPSLENISALKTAEFIQKNLEYIAVLVKDLKTGVLHTKLIGLSLLQKLQSKGATNSPAYKDWLLEMYQGKAIKYVLRKLAIDTMDTTIFRAFEVDDKNDVSYKEETKPQLQLRNNGLESFSSASITPTASNIDVDLGELPTIDVEELQ